MYSTELHTIVFMTYCEPAICLPHLWPKTYGNRSRGEHLKREYLMSFQFLPSSTSHPLSTPPNFFLISRTLTLSGSTATTINWVKNAIQYTGPHSKYLQGQQTRLVAQPSTYSTLYRLTHQSLKVSNMYFPLMFSLRVCDQEETCMQDIQRSVKIYGQLDHNKIIGTI